MNHGHDSMLEKLTREGAAAQQLYDIAGATTLCCSAELRIQAVTNTQARSNLLNAIA